MEKMDFHTYSVSQDSKLIELVIYDFLEINRIAAQVFFLYEANFLVRNVPSLKKRQTGAPLKAVRVRA